MSDPIEHFRRGVQEQQKLEGDARRRANLATLRARNDLVREYSTYTMRKYVETSDAAPPLTWFWFNHFNVFWQKALVGAALPSYVDDAIAPRVTGRFPDLLLAVVTHPAMLVYLDNANNVAGRVNENLARELLELHTLGVDGGYTQADVQAVARVLTGLGLKPLSPVKWPPHLAPLVVERGHFMFDPRRHDFEPKRVLGQQIAGKGFAEVEALVNLLAAHPSTARHVSRKLCQFIVGDGAPQSLLDEAAAAFGQTGGDLTKVVARIRDRASEGAAHRSPTFKDPMRWVISSVSLLGGGQPLRDPQPTLRWLAALGQPLFGRSTPDGYSLRGADWVSAGQLAQRFEIAREMVALRVRLFDEPAPLADLWRSEAVREARAGAGPATIAALERATDAGERMALLLSSPEFMVW